MIIIGITGGSGSGKTALARGLAAVFPSVSTLVLSQDSYYKDNAHLREDARQDINFDHPNAIDYDLMTEQLDLLMQGKTIHRPCYSFISCTRTSKTVRISPPDILLIEGILLLCNHEIASRIDLKIFIDTPVPVRLDRIIKRDLEKRGRTEEKTMQRFTSVVQPMHEQFIEPYKNAADLVLKNEQTLEETIDLTAAYVRSFLKNHPAHNF